MVKKGEVNVMGPAGVGVVLAKHRLRTSKHASVRVNHRGGRNIWPRA